MNDYGFLRTPFSFVSFYIIGDGGGLSVGAPYIRDCLNKTYHINSGGTKELVSVEEKDITILNNIDSIQDFADFDSKFNNLDRAIQSKMLGSEEDSDLENKLIQLKARIEGNGGMNDSQRNDFLMNIESLIKMSKGALRNTFSLDSIAAAKK